MNALFHYQNRRGAHVTQPVRTQEELERLTLMCYRNRYVAHADMDGEQIAAVWRDGQWLWFYDDTALPSEATATVES